jgi:hypothetical protein
LPGTSGLPLPVTAQVSGTVPALASFLDQLQNVQPRAVLVSQINETAAATGSAETKSAVTGLSVTLQVFVEPASAASR